MMGHSIILSLSILTLWVLPARLVWAESVSPVVEEELLLVSKIGSAEAAVRATAVENLSLTRAFGAADAVTPLLDDPDVSVRRNAAMNLGWTGSREQLPALVDALDDRDATVRQAATLALGNLTGQDIAFDGFGESTARQAALSRWRAWVERHAEDGFPGELAKMLQSDRWDQRTRAARALATFAPLPPAVEKMLIGELRQLVGTDQPESREERFFHQAVIRAAGRLGTAKLKAALIGLLDDPYWVMYAGEAVGDCIDEQVALALIAHYPDYGYQLDRAHHATRYKPERVKRVARADQCGFSSLDRIPRAAYVIMTSLARYDFESPATRRALVDMSPYLVATMPSDFDAIFVYDDEPWMRSTRYLLEKAGLREAVRDAAFVACGIERSIPADTPHRQTILELAAGWIDGDSGDPPFAGPILSTLSRPPDATDLIELLSHPRGHIRMHTAKALIRIDAKQAAPAIAKLLRELPDDVDFGYRGRFDWHLPPQGHDEFNDPCPRFKEAFLMALGRLRATGEVPRLTRFMNSPRNALEVQFTAARSLGLLATPEALDALRQAEQTHPYYSVRLEAREVLGSQSIGPAPVSQPIQVPCEDQDDAPSGLPETIVFIRGEHETPNVFQTDRWRMAYSTTDSGPTYRLGRNICRLDVLSNRVTRLTHFDDGYVADLEVSYDATRLLFCRRGGEDDPWWHVFEMAADGSRLRQITHGPYHDVQPNYMPDGRIVFSTSRLGYRDEYHGYLATGLATMDRNGSDIRFLGLNLGRDGEPNIGQDGRIVFGRLELFYSRLKTEWNLLSVRPDGLGAQTLYGPEKRNQWAAYGKHQANWGVAKAEQRRHRSLRISQVQPYGNSYVINSPNGPMLVHGRHFDRLIHPATDFAVTTPFVLDEATLLCAAAPVSEDDFDKPVNLGLYYQDIESGDLRPVYDDPDWSEFEGRPLRRRSVPPVVKTDFSNRATGTVYCRSVYNSRDPWAQAAKFARIVESLPQVARHQTHTGGAIAWRNHGGSIGRVLGTVPLASDGSFYVELPADRTFHIQALDADRQVVVNELIWQYVRPGEMKGCVGCHETPDKTPFVSPGFGQAFQQKPIPLLPNADKMRYRAKVWWKGDLSDEREERVRTVGAVNLMGRE